jgi:xanthine dehydrogenase YagS FAD-binding subunit
MDGNKCKSVRMVLGAAAPIPYRVTAVEEYLAGKRINETVAKKAGEISMEAARPLSQNNYKVPLFKNIIRHGLLKLA